MVSRAFKRVKSNKGVGGVDGLSLKDYEEDLSNNLYKLWNRLASGSYFPPAVKEVEIPKDNGKYRKLGIPTIADRTAQQVIKDLIETELEQHFHESSYGYRPLRSSHQALQSVKENVRKYAWVIDLDIKNFFNNVNHEKLLMALDRHIEEKWVKMYISRWLTAPVLKQNGDLEERNGKGTPQGGVVSPLLSNLYLHYAFDLWMEKEFTRLSFVRYADDMIIHCHSEEQAHYVLDKVQTRLRACDLELHPEKTTIVYCKDYRRVEKGNPTKFEFLGFSFRPESKASNRGGMFLGYDCTISKKKYSKIIQKFKDMELHRWSGATIESIAYELNPYIRGWMHYYEKFRKGSLKNVFHRLHNRLEKWILNKYKRFKRSRKRAFEYLKNIHKTQPYLFYHWKVGYAFV
ncbi:group II intron reverse transcriptase/nicotine-degrading enzyme NicX [Flavivirga jejuensis]